MGKTLVSSSMIDRVVKKLGRELREVPVGFKWFVPGLFDGSYCFGGEESAGASFLRLDGTVWTTDKDGPIMDLLAAEITARTGKDPGEHYRELTAEFGTPYYTRIDAPATPEQKARLQKLSPDAVKESDLAGEPITAKLTRAPGNQAPIGGLKVVADERLVCGPALRHGEHLQDLRGELQEPDPSECDRERSPGDGEQCSGPPLPTGACDERQRRASDCSAVSLRVPCFRLGCCTSPRCLRLTVSVTLGSSAFSWIDRLHHAGQRWWQSLPLA